MEIVLGDILPSNLALVTLARRAMAVRLQVILDICIVVTGLVLVLVARAADYDAVSPGVAWRQGVALTS
jgi:hypothetical protein